MNSFGIIVNSDMPAEPCTPSSLTLMRLLAESKLAFSMRECVCASPIGGDSDFCAITTPVMLANQLYKQALFLL
jgi:hypothetical protein